MEITEEAVEVIKQTMQLQRMERFFFRVGIEGNSRDGRGYAIQFVDEPRLTDDVLNISGLRVATSPHDKVFLSDLLIDVSTKDGKTQGLIFTKKGDK